MGSTGVEAHSPVSPYRETFTGTNGSSRVNSISHGVSLEEDIDKSKRDQHNVGEPLDIHEGPENATTREEARPEIVKIMGDGTSTAIDDIPEMRNFELPLLLNNATTDRIRNAGERYAKLTGLYVLALEARIGTLENHVRKLQVQMGWKKEDKSTGEPQSLDLHRPCHPSRPLNPLRLSQKEMRNKPWSTFFADDSAIVVLGFTSGPDIIRKGSAHPKNLENKMIRQKTTHVEDGASTSHTVGVTQTRATDLARIMFTSPWLLVVVELLTGQDLGFSTDSQWIYPFKYPVAYAKEIRNFVQLLDGMELSLKVDDLLPTLTHIAEEVATNFDLKRDDIVYSNDNTEKILQKAELQFETHFKKVNQIPPPNHEKEDTSCSTDPPILNGSAHASCQSNEDLLEEPMQKSPRMTCTCLTDARAHLQLLCDVIDTHLPDLLELQEAISVRTLTKIKFQDLWLLYRPGDLIVTSKAPHQAYRVIRVSGGRPLLTKSTLNTEDAPIDANTWQADDRKSRVSPFKIDCVRFDFDGEVFGPVQTTINIFEFDDERHIIDLEVYPMDFADNKSVLRKTLLARGQRFTTFRKYKHQKHAGSTLGDPLEEIDSEVIVDFARAFGDYNYSKNKPLLGLHGHTSSDCRETYEDICFDDECRALDHNRVFDDTKLDSFRRDLFVNAEADGLLLEGSYEDHPLSEDQLILLPYRIPGFSLRTRYFVSLNIENLSEVQDDEAHNSQSSAFDDLVIPDEYKRTVQALVKTQALGSGNSHQVDLVRGKGKGLIILLHGVPGVGKTSTAECVAAYTGRPLFPITCGDIGQTAQEVENMLDSIFLLARSWGCVLLLDEADVFLAKRQPDSVERNALVSVFLRTLEYYSGILFLTTNRIGSFDEAFISRIHISLYYADLDQESTLGVWDMNLNRLKRSGRHIYVDNKQIKSFAKSHWKDGHRWNGRQIRNAFQTAIALADYDFFEKLTMCKETGEKPPAKPALLPKHFKAVTRTNSEFDNYLSTVYGGSTHKEKARMAEIRNDNWVDQGLDTPTGKTYSTERAKRPSALKFGAGTGRSSEQETSKPPAQSEAVTHDGDETQENQVGEDEEFRLWREEKQKKEQEKRERLRRFELREMEMEK